MVDPRRHAGSMSLIPQTTQSTPPNLRDWTRRRGRMPSLPNPMVRQLADWERVRERKTTPPNPTTCRLADRTRYRRKVREKTMGKFTGSWTRDRGKAKGKVRGRMGRESSSALKPPSAKHFVKKNPTAKPTLDSVSMVKFQVENLTLPFRFASLCRL